MSEHRHCHDCGGHDGIHFDGCTYEGTGDVGGMPSYGRGRSSNVSAGKMWALYIAGLVIGYGINELLGVIIIIGAIFWLCVS